jgi:hypothetical protein
MNKEFLKMQKLAGIITESQLNEDLNLDTVDRILNDILEQYLDGIGENTDENGNIDFGGGVGYKNKKELLSDFISFIQNFE